MTRAQFDRSLMPPLADYLPGAGVAVPDRGIERRCDCPIRAHSSKRPFCFNADSNTWWCHVCGIGGDVLALHRAITGQTFREAARDLGTLVDEDDEQALPAAPAPRAPPAPDPAQDQEREHKAETARAIWQRAISLAGSIGANYLLGRRCRLPPADSDLRFIPDLSLWGFEGPCLVGRIGRAQDASEAIGLHLTWLRQSEGRWSRSERRYLGQKAGGVVRLWPDEAVTTGLSVAEGIETALAAAHAYAPIWAVMDAGNLARFPVLDAIEALTVFADRDKSGTGQAAAADCAERWLDAGREVTVLASSTIGFDIADEVAA